MNFMFKVCSCPHSGGAPGNSMEQSGWVGGVPESDRMSGGLGKLEPGKEGGKYVSPSYFIKYKAL